MNEMFRDRFIGLLSEPLQVTNKEIQRAYEDFLAEVEILNQRETDYQVVFRTMSLARVEFRSLQSQILYEQGKKCRKKSLFRESYCCCRL